MLRNGIFAEMLSQKKKRIKPIRLQHLDEKECYESFSPDATSIIIKPDAGLG